MKERVAKHVCLNCGSQVAERYCPRCGQEYGATRITWRSLYDEAVSLFIGDSIFAQTGAAPRYGMLQTLWRVVRHPARTVGEFLAGKQRRYVTPLTLLVLVCTLCLLTLSGLGYELLDSSSASEGEAADTVLSSLFGFLNGHLEIVALLKIPWMALALKWVFRRRSHLRYMEYFYIGLYLASLYIILTTFVTILSHACGIDPDGTTHFLMNRTVLVTLYLYYVIIIRSILGISTTRSALGCLASQAVATVLSLTAIILMLIPWEIASGQFF